MTFSSAYLFDPYPTFVKPIEHPNKELIPDGELKRMSELLKSNKVVYKDDKLIVIHPFEMMIEKVKNNKNRLLIDEISGFIGEYIDVNDPALYIFVFIEDKYYYGDMYKAYFKDTSLLLSPIFIYKFTDYIESKIIQRFKKIAEWFGSYILQQHSYSSDVLNRMDFHIIAYHVGGIELRGNVEKFYSRHVSESTLFQKQFTRLLLLLNSIAPKENKLKEYIFPITFKATNNEIISTCEILNHVFLRQTGLTSQKNIYVYNHKCF
jgi:hypothetical protein